MTRHTRGIAAAIAGFVSLSLVGVALANEPGDPVLEEEATEVVCPDPGTDEGGTDGTTDEGTTDEGTTDEGTTDDATDAGATDGGVADDATTDGTADSEADDTVVPDGCENPDAGTDGTDGTEVEELEATDDEDEDDAEDADVEDGERPQNHGWYVSEATKTCPESGRERGQCISEVAKSDLGKPHADDDVAEPEDGADASLEGTEDAGPSQAAKATRAPKASKGGGGGKGRGGKG